MQKKSQDIASLKISSDNLYSFDNLPKASTIMMVRYIDNAPYVLLVERNPSLVFAGGAFVFPGGRFDKSDNILAQNTDPNPNYELENAKIAAARECFEEIGYLPAYDANGNMIGDKYANNHETRNKINNNPSEFTNFIISNQFNIAHHELIPVSIWYPPLYANKRFITWFFVLEIIGEQNIIIDDNEIVSYRWIKPSEALEKMNNGEMKALFPTKAHLSFIGQFSSINQIKDFLNCKKIPLVHTNTIDKGSDLWVDVDYKDYYPYHKEHISLGER